MFSVTLITGIAFGLEYFDSPMFGFGVNLDLGIFRFTWYRDMEEDDVE